MTAISRHLETLRSKPDHIKRHIAFWTSLSVTLVIVLFWVASFSFGASPSQSSSVAVQSPWSAMSASVGDAWTSLKTALGGSPVTYQAPLEVTAGKQ